MEDILLDQTNFVYANTGGTLLPSTRVCCRNIPHKYTYTRFYCALLCRGCTIVLNGIVSLLWRHNWRDGVSNHQPRDCLLNRSFRRRSKKTSKLRVTGLCVGNSPVTGEFPHKWPVTRKMFPFHYVIVWIIQPLYYRLLHTYWTHLTITPVTAQ